MPTRPTKDPYSNQASEVDTRMSATIKAANELQKKTQDIDKQKQGSLQVYHQQKRELKDFLAGLYATSGNHVVLPNEEIADEIKRKREKKEKRGKFRDRKPPKQKQKRHETTASKFLSISGTGGLNALGAPLSDDDTETSSDDNTDSGSGSKQSDGSADYNKDKEKEISDDDDEAYCKTRELIMPKLPNISKHHSTRRRTFPNMKTDRKFDIAKFRRRFSYFDRSAAYDGLVFARNNIDDDDDDHPPPLTRSTLASLESKPTELRAKIQQWCDSIDEDWFHSKDDDGQSDTDQSKNLGMKQENDTKVDPDHQHLNTNDSQLLRFPTTFSRSTSRQRSPLPPSRSRSRRSSHVNIQVPRNLRARDKSKTDTNDDEHSCDIELVDGGFGLVGTRVVKKTSLPVSRLLKDGDRAGDPLVPGHRNFTNHFDKRVHFDAVNGGLGNAPATRMSSMTRPKSQSRTKSDSGVDDLEFEIQLSIRNSSDHVDDDGIHPKKSSNHSCHECKVYRGQDSRALRLADPLTLARMAQAQTRVVQRQRARMRRESYSYSASASIDAALRYNQIKWSM